MNNKSIIYRVEYYEYKISKWVSYWSDKEYSEELEHQFNFPIIGNPMRRIVKYEKSGVRKIKYKLIEVLKEGYASKEMK